jgi:uncharacterized protein YcfJ
MKNLLLASSIMAVASLSALPASAGCITGAVVGGIAGHMVGHGGIGAAAGCAYGHHRKNEARRNDEMNTGRSSANGASTQNR